VNSETPAAPRPRPPIELKVEYKKLNSFFSDYAKNISKGGTFIRTDRPLRIGTEFLFSLVVPTRESPFVLPGRVAWIHGPEGSQLPTTLPPGSSADAPFQRGMGITFLFESDEARRQFEEEVEAMMRASLGEFAYQKIREATR
jgi:type IV pilus assembly protein PilZ